MKKLFTPENYLTGLLTSIVLFTFYFLFKTTDSWKYVLGLIGTIVTFSLLGYVVNTLANKYIK
jgi:hypothetical protein